MGNSAEGLAYLQQTMDLIHTIEIKTLKVSIFESIARAYLSVSEFTKAHDSLQKALSYLTTDKNAHFDLYFLLATIFRKEGNYKKAEQVLDELNNSLGAKIEEIDQAFITHEKGNILLDTHNYLAAEKCFILADSILSLKDGYETELAVIYNSLGLVNLELQQYVAAIDYLEEAIYISESYGLFDQCADCLLYTSPSPRDLSTSRMPSSA